MAPSVVESAINSDNNLSPFSVFYAISLMENISLMNKVMELVFLKRERNFFLSSLTCNVYIENVGVRELNEIKFLFQELLVFRLVLMECVRTKEGIY